LGEEKTNTSLAFEIQGKRAVFLNLLPQPSPARKGLRAEFYSDLWFVSSHIIK